MGGSREPVLLDGKRGVIVKACGCGRTFTEHEWSLLKSLGPMVDPEFTIELRNCPCGSTIAIETETRK